MISSDALIREVIELSKLEKQLNEAGGSEAEGDLFEDYLAARTEILEQFGLPETEEFLFLLASADIFTPEEAEDVIDALHRAAKEYLLSPVRREVQVLEEAKAEGYSA